MTGGLDLPVVIDSIVAVLLVATIVYAIILNRKLTALRNSKTEMESLVGRFAESTAKAQRGVESLKAHAETSASSLESKASRARGLVDELTFVIETGESLARRLEDAIHAARADPSKRSADRASTVRPVTSPGAAVGTRHASVKAVPADDDSPQDSDLRAALRGIR